MSPLPVAPAEFGVPVLRQPNPMVVGEFMYGTRAIPDLPVEQGRWVGKVRADALANLVQASMEWRRWENGAPTPTRRAKRHDFIAAVRVVEMLDDGGVV